MDDIVIDYNDIEIIDYGDEKYISISLRSSSDEGYRTLYRLAGFNPKDYDEIKDKPEDIADFYLQIFPDGNLKIDGNPLNAEVSKFFNKELHMNIWDKYIADSFKEIRPYKNYRPYGTDKELDELVDSKDCTDREKAAEQGYGLDRLVDDKEWNVRRTVAGQGYGLDKLVDDKDGIVRYAVARQGYGLDRLVDDEDVSVRRAVAEQGFGLDKLVNDEDWNVRVAVARQGYGLDRLVDDKDASVRRAVAEQGYGLDKLADDKNEYIRIEVVERGYALDKLVNDKNGLVRQKVAEQGYGLDNLIDDEKWYVRKAAKWYLEENKYKNIDEWKKDNPDKVYYKDDRTKGEER